MNKIVASIEGGRHRLRRVTPKLPAPAADVRLDEADVSFAPVKASDPASPVRMYHRGICAGVFASVAAADGTRRLLLGCLFLFLCFTSAPMAMAGAACPLAAAPVLKIWPALEFSIPGTASWYGEEHRGDIQANGQPFDPDRPSAAYAGAPLGSLLCVSAGERRVWVFVTDRPGRAVRRQGRLIDLSAAAFRQLAPLRDGLANVRVEVIWRPDR